MKKIKNIVASSDLLKWLISAVLVMGLLTADASVFRQCNSEPFKIELNEARGANSRRVVYFKAFDCPKAVRAEGEKEHFISIQFHLKNETTVKLKLNRKELPSISKQSKGFLKHFSTKNSEEFLNPSIG